MIARDEERCIRRAIDSVAPYVDRLIIVDTGSTDETVSIAHDAGAEVYKFTWCDDFAAAKNYGISLAHNGPIFSMDADEWLTSGGETLQAWASLCAVSPTFGTVTCVSVSDAGGIQHEVADELIRLLPGGAIFRGRIHEQPVGDFPTRRTSVCLRHDGYLKAQWERKLGRNEAMIRAELALNGNDGYLWFQLGCALAIESRHREASDAFSRARPLVGIDSPQRHPLVVRHLYSLGRSQQFDEALYIFREECQVWSNSPDLYFVLADTLLDRALHDPGRADVYLPLMRSCWKRCLEIGERPDLPGSVRGRGSFSSQHNLSLLDDLEGLALPLNALQLGHP